MLYALAFVAGLVAGGLAVRLLVGKTAVQNAATDLKAKL
jgi:uncharacterized membrane-anchored protein YhcB (DUF1043 family)